MGDTDIRLAEPQGPVEVLAHLIRGGMRGPDDMARLAKVVQDIAEVAVEEALESMEAREREAQDTGNGRT